MEKLTRRRYTLEYKQEAVRLTASGRKVSAAAKALGMVERTLTNWVQAEKVGQLRVLCTPRSGRSALKDAGAEGTAPRVLGWAEDFTYSQIDRDVTISMSRKSNKLPIFSERGRRVSLLDGPPGCAVQGASPI